MHDDMLQYSQSRGSLSRCIIHCCFRFAAFQWLKTLLRDILNKLQQNIIEDAFPLLLNCPVLDLNSRLKTKPPSKKDPCLGRKE